MFALVDGNNFYVSCEQVFQPRLKGRPVVVLSNNDGCAIARSDEAKALGVKMGHPYFQMVEEWRHAGIEALSANFVLYGDMSARMMQVASALGPEQEIYSIDESFIGLHGVPGDLTRRGFVMRARLLQWLGLPCGIGMGSTKTLAKLANHVAKSAIRKPGSYPGELGGVCNLAALPASDLDAVLAATPVGEVWGIGRKISRQLEAAGVCTALDAARMSPAAVRARWSVVLERTIRELQGQPCQDLQAVAPDKQEIACTRSFGRPVTALADLIQAVTEFASRAAEKLRAQQHVAGQIMVFIRTSPFRKAPQYGNAVTVPLVTPTAGSVELVEAACAGLQVIYREGFQYAKAGVMLLDLRPQGQVQCELDLFGQAVEVSPGVQCCERGSARLMAALDALNDRFGKGAVRLASAGVQDQPRRWDMRQERRTPQYTTSWSDIPLAAA